MVGLCVLLNIFFEMCDVIVVDDVWLCGCVGVYVFELLVC